MRVRTPRLMLLLIGLALLAPGCGGGSNESLDSFTKRWHAAVNQSQAGELYDMLDAASQRHIRHDLELMRGLPDPQQQEVINQLGGERVKSLKDLTPQRYFARLWEKITLGKKPRMSIEAQGGNAAYMILSLDGGQSQRVRLTIEGGRWVWVLPSDAPVQSAEAK